MKVFVVFLAACFLVVVSSTKSEMIDIDVTSIRPSVEKGQSQSAINSGDDDNDDEGSAVQSDEGSGSGSGQFTTKIVPSTQEVQARVKTEQPITRKPTKFFTKMPTEHIRSTQMPKETHMSTEKVIVVKKSEGKTIPPSEAVMTIKPTTEDENMLGGGVSKDGDVAARKGLKEAATVLTTEVIAAVIVGGVCAIILIAFLVYRLRKRDEGSYILTDTAYNDTNKLRGDTGKEAFV